jgi:hypothetical protein
MIKNHRTLDEIHSGPMKKNERSMKIIERWKKRTQRSTKSRSSLAAPNRIIITGRTVAAPNGSRVSFRGGQLR